MSYEVVFDDAALDFLGKLPKELRARIFNKVISAKENPHYYFERLVGRSDFKLRVGDYRIIADINETKKRIEVTLVRHRKNAYKNLPAT